MSPSLDDINSALVWKYGHSNKTNFPESHKEIIAKIQCLWKYYECSDNQKISKETFNWWEKKLNNKKLYITYAFITHLIHSNDVPIIDQHNFRAMNSLIYHATPLNPPKKNKKKANDWDDIMDLKNFKDKIIMQLNNLLEKPTNEQYLDRFLMVYGRDYVPR